MAPFSQREILDWSTPIRSAKPAWDKPRDFRKARIRMARSSELRRLKLMSSPSSMRDAHFDVSSSPMNYA
jgi:hypothetical protein